MILLLSACGSSSAPAPAPAVPAPVAAPAPAAVPVERGPSLLGLCDASAAVVSGAFLVVADDERNVLRVFDAASFAPAGTVDLAALAPMMATKKEADLEGMAAQPDGTIWIIGSHDAGKDTERKESRQRLLAIRLAAASDGRVAATLAHGPTDRFLAQAQDTNQLRDVVATTVGHTSKDPSGLSIEGLAAGPAGSLLVGFRAPVHDGKALIVRLDDPATTAAGAPPALTGPRWVPLGGRGIRDLGQDGDGWLVLAGPAGDGKDFALFRWKGFDDGAAPVQLPVSFGDLHPEALVKIGSSWWVLSDDGREEIGGTACKDLPESQRITRTARIASGL